MVHFKMILSARLIRKRRKKNGTKHLRAFLDLMVANQMLKIKTPTPLNHQIIIKTLAFLQPLLTRAQIILELPVAMAQTPRLELVAKAQIPSKRGVSAIKLIRNSEQEVRRSPALLEMRAALEVATLSVQNLVTKRIILLEADQQEMTVALGLILKATASSLSLQEMTLFLLPDSVGFRARDLWIPVGLSTRVPVGLEVRIIRLDRLEALATMVSPLLETAATLLVDLLPIREVSLILPLRDSGVTMALETLSAGAVDLEMQRQA
mmetsp:Transcript_6889/g.9544  ORF Transcript_6889/g.9544 Transcript_6889/m.9544 type:complete len:265 (-) Transcript_6889:616-1410(-)